MSKNILLLGSNGYLGSRIKVQLRNQYSIFELNRKEIQALDFNQNKILDYMTNYLNSSKKLNIVEGSYDDYDKNEKGYTNIQKLILSKGIYNINKSDDKYNYLKIHYNLLYFY